MNPLKLFFCHPIPENVDSVFYVISINLFEFAYSRFIFLKNLNDILWVKAFELQNGFKNNLFLYDIPVIKVTSNFYSVVLKKISKLKILFSFLINLVEYYLYIIEFVGLNETTERVNTYKFLSFNTISSYFLNIYPNIFINKNLKSSDFDYDIEQSQLYLIDFVDYSFVDHKKVISNMFIHLYF